MFYKILSGLVFIGLIGLVVLNALGFVNLWGIFFIAGFVFIIFGLYIFLKKHSLLGGALFGFTGIVFLLAQFYDWVWVVLLPGLLLLIGIGIFFSRGKKTDPLLVCGDYSQEEVKISAFFNTAECYMRSDDFKGGYIHSTFGTARIDLSGVNIRKDVTLDVAILFGKVELILPGYVGLDNQVTSIIGEVREVGSSGKAPVFHLKGTVICGNIHVFFK